MIPFRPPNFIRFARVTIVPNSLGSQTANPIILEGLRVSFNISKSLSTSLNPGNIKIWNLSGDHRNLITGYGDFVQVEVAYFDANQYQLLYSGYTTSVSHVFDVPDIITILDCLDGDFYVSNTNGSLNFSPDTDVRTILNTISERLGLSANPLPSDFVNLSYPNGFSSSGSIKTILKKVCDYAKIQYSIQNNKLQFIFTNGHLDLPPYPINIGTGMIGVPQRYTWKRQDLYVQRSPSANSGDTYNGPAVGWKVNHLLYPAILPGSLIDLESRYIQSRGNYRVESIKHEGDTYGPLWISSMEVTQSI